jgi:RNA polymerase sigma-70 factor (ECF subfamily)
VVLDAIATLSRDDPENELHRRELSRLVQAVLDQLPARYGDALEWKYIEGIPVQEIARRLGLGYKAAESLLTRARQAFREGFGLLEG